MLTGVMPSSASARILLADDSELVREVIGSVLAESGLGVLTAASGQEAIDIALREREAIDLIILDVMMPDLTGHEVTRQLRADPTARFIPVLLLTSLNTTGDTVVGLESGADDFVNKTVPDEELIARARALIFHGRMRRRVSGRVSTNASSVRISHETGELSLRDSSPRDTAPSEHSASILVVHEADEIKRDLLPALQDEGHSIRVIANPGMLPRELTHSAPDMVIVSYEAATGEPFSLLDTISSWKSPPSVFVIDENAGDGHLTCAYEHGADAYVNLYTPVPEIMARVKSVLRRRERYRSLETDRDRALVAAISDPMTGLCNRAYFDQTLNAETSRAERYGHQVGLIILDLDHFKLVNDTYGHPAGDRVLREVAQRVVTTVRVTDVAARYGGEEFAIITPHSDEQATLGIAERLRCALMEEPIEVDESLNITVTGSFGVAVSASLSVKPEYLIERADAALYAAKREGRNRVMVAKGATIVPYGPRTASETVQSILKDHETITFTEKQPSPNAIRRLEWLTRDDPSNPYIEVQATLSALLLDDSLNEANRQEVDELSRDVKHLLEKLRLLISQLSE